MGYEERFWQLVEKRSIILFGDINADKQEGITLAITSLNGHSTGPIKFLLDSSGGTASHTLIIHDTLVHSLAPVNGLIMGKAHSGAFILSQAFKRRVAYPHATFIIHGPSLDGLRSDDKDLAGKIQFRKDIHTEMLNIIARRTGQPMKKLREWSREERVFIAREALKLNFIDEIAKPPQ